MIRSMRAIFLASALAGGLVLSGCAGVVTLVSAGPYAVGEGYNVAIGRPWNDVSAAMPNRMSNVRVLSTDGPLLDRLYLAHDIAPGAGFIRPANREQRVPVYRQDMTSRELVEFLTETVAALDYTNVAAETLAPADFAGRPGVQFLFTAQTKEGLNISGRAAAAARDGKLQAMVYLAPSEHFYAAYSVEVGRIFASVLGEPPAPPPPAPAAVEVPPPQPVAQSAPVT